MIYQHRSSKRTTLKLLQTMAITTVLQGSFVLSWLLARITHKKLIIFSFRQKEQQIDLLVRGFSESQVTSYTRSLNSKHLCAAWESPSLLSSAVGMFSCPLG